MDRINIFQSLGENYFYTEFFFLDKVEKIIKESSKKYLSIIKNLKEMGKLKLETREVLNKFYNYKKIFAQYIEEVGRRFNRTDLPWLSYKEIINVLDGKEVKISEREYMNWLLTKENNWDIIVGKIVKKVLVEFDNYFFKKKIGIIGGTTANGGIYRGTVKIIRTVFSNAVLKEIEKVKKGDVLVAETTGPEIMVACKKAGAIITDEGGITCHAAIISRELKIPCIIGTKIATQVLKDGDLVEVDAKRGLVRKIK